MASLTVEYHYARVGRGATRHIVQGPLVPGASIAGRDALCGRRMERLEEPGERHDAVPPCTNCARLHAAGRDIRAGAFR